MRVCIEIDDCVLNFDSQFPISAAALFNVCAAGELDRSELPAQRAGLTLIEVQQNSETTYRLYDYGRPRDFYRGNFISPRIFHQLNSCRPA